MSLNLAECIAWTAETSPDNTALVIGKVSMTYAELFSAVKRVSNLLDRKGYGQGDRIALMLPNVPQFVIAYHGILHRGCTVVPANPMLRARELRHYFETAEVKAAFVWHECMPEAAKAAALCASPPLLISVESGFVPEPPLEGESFLSLMAEAEPVGETAFTQPHDLAAIQFTSATEGTPRGAMLTHFNLWHNAWISSEKVFRYFPEDVCLAVLPFFHTFGQTTMMNAALLSGSRVVLVPRFEAGKILETVEREGVTLLAMVPTMFHMLVAQKGTDTADISSLRAVITGGAPMPRELAAAFHDRYGMEILEGYGLTETSPVVAFNVSQETNRPGSVGQAIYGCRVRVLRDDDSVADPEEVGEVVVRGPNVMQGYLKDPEGTAAAFHDGWLRTGDYGYLDRDGYLFLTGLKKDMLLRAGMNVYPRELEKIILEFPGVAEAGVVGMPDPLRGEEALAYVVPESGTELDERALAQHCREQMASYKCPRRFVIVGSLPKTADGDVDKDQLRNAAEGAASRS